MFNSCTSIKISSTQSEIYNNSWRIPTDGIVSSQPEWGSDILSRTGGPFTASPTINTTYYYSLT
jgi:hypothetical protein